MAPQSLTIKDGVGSIKSLTVESSSYGFIPIHQITSSASEPIYITASLSNPLPVTGNISVDVVVGDTINVTASIANPLAVTGTVATILPALYNSATYTTNTSPIQLIGTNGYKATVDTSGRLFVTGAVTVNTGSLITVTASSAAPVFVTGTITVNTASSIVSVSNFPASQTITASLANPVPVTGTLSVDVIIGDIITVTASAANPVFVTGAITVNTASSVVSVSNFPATQTVTASLASPLGVTGSVNVNNSVLSVTSSLLNPVYALAATPAVTTVVQTVSSSFVWNTIASGTFAIATSNPLRRGLTAFNPGPHNLFVALSTAGGGGDAGRHGFTLVNTASAPSVYSFIVYPSGTYTADATTVGVYHGGYFISGSASAGVFIAAIS